MKNKLIACWIPYIINYYQPEWKAFQPYEQNAVFTPDKSVTIALPQGKIASTYNNQDIGCFWNHGASASSGAMAIGRRPETSVAFTPTADWDETSVAAYAYRADKPNDLWERKVTYMLKSDGSVPTPPDDPATPDGAASVPKTGDETPLTAFGALLLLSLAGLTMLLIRRRSA